MYINKPCAFGASSDGDSALRASRDSALRASDSISNSLRSALRENNCVQFLKCAACVNTFCPRYRGYFTGERSVSRKTLPEVLNARMTCAKKLQEYHSNALTNVNLLS